VVQVTPQDGQVSCSTRHT